MLWSWHSIKVPETGMKNVKCNAPSCKLWWILLKCIASEEVHTFFSLQNSWKAIYLDVVYEFSDHKTCRKKNCSVTFLTPVWPWNKAKVSKRGMAEFIGRNNHAGLKDLTKTACIKQTKQTKKKKKGKYGCRYALSPLNTTTLNKTLKRRNLVFNTQLVMMVTSSLQFVQTKSKSKTYSTDCLAHK